MNVLAVLSHQLGTLKVLLIKNFSHIEVCQASSKRTQTILLKAFLFRLEMVNLSEEQIKMLENYFYANHLIIQYKQAAMVSIASNLERN
jgi:uncharacterized protein (DUF1919 family)